MLKLTYESLDNIKLLADEKKWLIKLLDFSKKHNVEIFLFWSRLKWRWADIDLIVKWNEKVSVSLLVKMSAIFHRFSSTKLDIIPYDEKNSVFLNYIFKKY